MARPHPVPLIAGVIVGIVTFLLGNWQVQRAGEKGELQRLIEAGADAPPVSASSLVEPREWLAVELRGEWRGEATIYLDNRPHEGRPGADALASR